MWDSRRYIGQDSRSGHDSRLGSGRILKCIWAGFQSRIRWDGWSGIPEQDRGDSKADQMVLMEQDWGTMDTVGSGGIPEQFLLSVEPDPACRMGTETGPHQLLLSSQQESPPE